MSAMETKLSNWTIRRIGSDFSFASRIAAPRTSGEKTCPLTAMIFDPGTIFALSAGPFQRTSLISLSALTRRPMEYQAFTPTLAVGGALAVMIVSEGFGLSA